MPEAQSIWTKRVGVEPNQQNKHSNEVPEPKTEKMAMYTWREPHRQLKIEDWSPKIERYINQ